MRSYCSLIDNFFFKPLLETLLLWLRNDAKSVKKTLQFLRGAYIRLYYIKEKEKNSQKLIEKPLATTYNMGGNSVSRRRKIIRSTTSTSRELN